MKVTLILTVLNEANNISAFLNTLAKQTRFPDEVIVCDAGSTDGTTEILREFATSFSAPFKVIIELGNRSHGRNTAIQKAQHDLIVGTDAGCTLDPNWLKYLINPFEMDEIVEVVSGFYSARGETTFERCAAVVTLSTTGVDPQTFLPSTRSIAFRRDAWKAVGGFSEDIECAEDTKFALDLRKIGKHFAFAQNAIVYWRPRRNFRQVFRQFCHYSRGDAQARILAVKYVRLHCRYILWMSIFIMAFQSSLLWIMWAIAFMPYSLFYSIRGLREVRDWRAFFLTPLIKLVADLGNIAGYWKGKYELLFK